MSSRHSDSKAYSVSQWGFIDDIAPVINPSFPGREIVTIGVGEKNGEYVTETIFRDVLDKILTKEYRLDFRMEQTPMFCISNGLELIRYNPEIGELSAQTKRIINNIDDSIKVGALTEFRLNRNSKNKLGKAAQTLKQLVKQEINKDYNINFLEALLKEIYLEDVMSKFNDVERSIHAMPNDMLIDLYGQILNYMEVGDLGQKQLKTLSNFQDVYALSSELNAEIARRFYCGDIR